MKIYKETVSELLWQVLNKLMGFEELKSFRLVGGTCLSLILGHRISIDIDMFSDAEYKSVDFVAINKLFSKSFKYVDYGLSGNDSLGKSYFIGNSKADTVKLDLFYTDAFQYPVLKYQELRLSHLEEIIAMKLELIGHNGRKKDFWDIHELMQRFSWQEMLSFFEKRYPYSHTKEELIIKLTDFEKADLDFNPICLKDKYWELIKLDIEESVETNFR
ncbi:MAG: nucleotidyl transferase AbiEii/AbiGii toxin family protein [Bacteroidales bacterium]|nr:nucleotidyl transferase AbiEii/AbiGii toxin family protein [Bacteroidales bacterium]MCF8392095.1 nucleotidyl transferase AbiEii/AbiGii toxin family protein [Bacteroidales bacterium]